MRMPNADAAFAASYIGKNYDGDLDIEGWDDQGGGLIATPIYIHQYQREDGTYLVITSRQLAKESKDTPANYEVVDALIVPPPQAGVEFTISCVQGKDETLRFIGDRRAVGPLIHAPALVRRERRDDVSTFAAEV